MEIKNGFKLEVNKKEFLSMKEEHRIIPCFLQDAVEASRVHEVLKKIESIFK